jgi:predicted Zn-dependent protease
MLIPLTLLAAITSGCAVQKQNIRGFNLVSVDEERELGNKFAAEVEKQHTVVKDPELQRYVDALGKKLLTGAREINFDYQFKVVKDDSVNAFAIPGGHVYIHTGLLKAADSEAELAGVLAHEINHVVARHGTQQLTQRYGYSMILSLVLGKDPNMIAQLAASMFGEAGLLAYSRGMEAQADYLGVETMDKAGFDPSGMTRFFKKLDGMGKENPSKLARFFSSHPLTQDRVREVQDQIKALPPRQYQADSPEFLSMKRRIP